MRSYLVLFTCIFVFWSCGPKPEKERKVEFTDTFIDQYQLTEKQLYDKVLGMIVGSAIGDAMGAPTEMWSRPQIQQEYGFVQSLDSMYRSSSPEGTWHDSLPAGGTTDDTRWKILLSEFLITQDTSALKANDFAKYIGEEYQSYLKELQQVNSSDYEPYKPVLLKMGWLQEWSKVSTAFISEDVSAYSDALGKFYGGEMVCAGLLYSSSVGAYFPGNPSKAYQEAFKLSIYDIGYAKDVTSMAAAMTSAAMSENPSIENLKAALEIDPRDYFDSRLVGRSAYVWVKEAARIDSESRGLDSLNSRLSLESAELAFAFQELDKRQQDMPFHAGEIFLQTLTGMYYADFDFMGTLTFLTNYGRDNDTTGALAGGILGAFYGFEALPKKEKELVLYTAKSKLNQDLEQTAKGLTAHMLGK
ncbi:ADP-ribosylglycohydrolase family protein [Algoriphagus sediminis]|uniref:ADP-ribosylglycohydrolase family protein n=1 Tax=Algoriphagus sediminis TaxID=3057113 RepID=A0ABT7YDQ4_9BACT|nr:ADP-ribosylglycohydrolase family protein [Algoriphagus sediminis]MDN3204596.1 ADP-ribosylglycohydrolase family protein [Algoriphagus sediminis]